MNLARIRKALAAGAGSFSGAVATAAADGTLTGRDWASHVRDFQREKHLTVDGIFGPQCCRAVGWRWAG